MCVVMATACASIAGAFAQTPPAAAQTPLSIAVVGNHFVNGAGQTIRLLGVNHPSLEYGCVDGYGYSDGHMDEADAAAIAAWSANAVRVPLNEDCWLGINGQPNSSQGANPPLTMAGYRQAVESYVAALNAHGLYAILDLHWSAPGSIVANGQQPMPDEHSTAFWSSVAATFKSDPAVVFDLFNEPFSPTDPRSGNDPNPAHSVTWACWENGGCTVPAYNETATRTATTYTAVGMQALVTAIRATGATQPVMIGGLDYANDLTGWVKNAPHDPLGQEAASFHNYMGKSCDDVGCWNGEIAPVAAAVPVVTGEFAQEVCAPSNFDNEYMNWADAHGVSYLAWAWIALSSQEIAEKGCSAYSLITDYDGTPASPNGANLREHLLALASAGVTVAPASPTSTSTAAAASAGGGGTKQKSLIALAAFHAHVAAGGASISFELRSTQSCKGSLSGQTTKPFKPESKAHKRRHVPLGTVDFKLPAGKSRSVVLQLSDPAQRLLAARGSLAVGFTLTLSGPSGRTVLHRTATLKKPVRHRHRA
jgi:endoglucanase